MEQLFTFKLTQQEAIIIVAALRKLPAPMDIIEPIVKKMEEQFAEQNKPKVEETATNTTTDEVKPENSQAA